MRFPTGVLDVVSAGYPISVCSLKLETSSGHKLPRSLNIYSLYGPANTIQQRKGKISGKHKISKGAKSAR